MEDILFHYTDIPALMGIIENNEFWLSNSRFLNDPSEQDYARSIFIEEIESFSEESQQYFEPLKSWILGVNSFHDRFILALSVYDDSLLLWERYADGKGCCLHLESEELIKNLKNNTGEIRLDGFFPMIYDPIMHRNWLQQYLEQYLKSQQNNISFPINSKETSEFTFRLFSLFLSMKHIAYENEIERRFIFSLPNRNSLVVEDIWKNNINFRTRNNRIIPFIKMKVDLKKVLKAITLGPLLSDNIDKQGIEDFLYKNGFYNLPVTISDIPFRK